MEIILAKKILELSDSELADLLLKLQMENHDAFKALQEAVDDLL
jgi:hypothetical protein